MMERLEILSLKCNAMEGVRFPAYQDYRVLIFTLFQPYETLESCAAFVGQEFPSRKLDDVESKK